MPRQVLNMSSCHKVMYGCEVCISKSMIQCDLNTWRQIYREKLRSVFEISHLRISDQ